MIRTIRRSGIYSHCRRVFARVPIPLFIPVLALLFSPPLPANADTPIDQVLPFKRPPLSTLQSKDHKACAVWHVWRISVENAPPERDAYAMVTMNPMGNDGEYYDVGGGMRERPLPRPVSSDPDWKIRDMETEVRRASDIGLDCFFFSLCTIGEGTNCWDKMRDAMKATNNIGNGFKIVPMMDIASLNNQKASPAFVATWLASIAKDPSLMRDNAGRIYIGSTNGDRIAASWWSSLKSELQKRGVGVSFMLTVQGFGSSKDQLLPIVDGMGPMGFATPYFAREGTAEKAKEAQARNKLYIAGIKAQDFRPHSGWFLEAGNFDSFRLGLMDAIRGDANWLVFNSWNDRYEHHEIAPSTGIQWALYDLAAYYITWFKMRTPPTISRDVLYYSHRIMRLDTPYNRNRQPRAIVRATFQTQQPNLNQIELLAFLTRPGTLRIETSKGANTTAAQAGITSLRADLANGYPRFSLLRDGAVRIRMDSAFQVRDTTTWQDFLYRSGSSTRPVVSMVANPPVTN